jgi:hypothetical protein
VAVLPQALDLEIESFELIQRGIAELWRRMVANDPRADQKPLLLSYDVHPSPAGPVLIEVNTNAGGIMTAISAAHTLSRDCADWERAQLRARLLELFERDLLGSLSRKDGVLAIVDDQLEAQTLLPEMKALAELFKTRVAQVLVLDASELRFAQGRLRFGELAIDAVYWRSTDFLIAEPRHEAIKQALDAGSLQLAPSPDAYRAIAQKSHFVRWSAQPVLAQSGSATFSIAETWPLASRAIETWYQTRADWVFKPISGHASRGVYVGKSISRARLESLAVDDYLAQRYAPHPSVLREGASWKYDLRFFADRGEIIAAAARVFQGQVVGMRTPGSGFAPIQVGTRCCLLASLAGPHRSPSC